MSRRGHGLVIALTLWLALAAFSARPSVAAPVAAGGDPNREVLVLLRLTPEHFRPGTDYSDSYDDAMARAARRRIAGRLAHSHGLALIGDWPMPLVGGGLLHHDGAPGAIDGRGGEASLARPGGLLGGASEALQR